MCFFCVCLFPTFWEGHFEGLEGMLLGALCSFDPLGTFVMGPPEGIMTVGLELVLTLAPECNLGLSAGIATKTFVFEFSSAKRVELLSRIFWGLLVAKLVEVFSQGVWVGQAEMSLDVPPSTASESTIVCEGKLTT